MPFARPSLTELRNQSIQDITTSGVPGLTGLLRNAVLRVLAWCMAGLAYGVYGYADWIARMGVPFTAEDEFLYAWAALVGIYPKPATGSTGAAQFTGNPGIVVPANTSLRRQDGAIYTSTEDATVDGTGVVVVPIESTDLGTFTNADDATPIAITPPIIGINSNGVTVGAITGGADAETSDQLRTRMLYRYREPPQGGAATDYVEWALEVPGCTRAWANPIGAGAGTVVVYPMFDVTNASSGGFPQGTNGVAQDEVRDPVIATGDQLTVADHIYPLQPVTALVYVDAPLPQPIDITLASLEPNTVDIHTMIGQAVDDLFLIEGAPGATIYPSQLYDAILSVPGIKRFDINAPADPVVLPMGYVPVMGTLTTS